VKDGAEESGGSAAVRRPAGDDKR